MYKKVFNRNRFRFKNLFLLFSLVLILFLGLNKVFGSVGQGENIFNQFNEDLTPDQENILQNGDNEEILDVLTTNCSSRSSGSARDNCFEQVQLTQILMIDDYNLCDTLSNLSSSCYLEFASQNNDDDICDLISENEEKNDCVASIIKNEAMKNDDITLCNDLSGSYWDSCVRGVMGIQNNISYCSNNSLIVNNNLGDLCLSIILSNRAADNNDSDYCGQIPLSFYQENCFLELGLFCGDGICTNVYESISSCPQDCIFCGDGICTNGYETISSCPQDCTICGDGICDPSFEDINLCPQDCFVCGDGQVTPPNESCDDGSNNGQYGYCNSTCSGSGEYCGDGTVTAPEVCEQNQGPVSCLIDGYEGNKSCKSDCSGFTACIASEFCGDFIKNGSEECDNGGLVAQDGCNSYCVIETGWECTDSLVSNQYITSNCTPICGDGIVVNGEECDDGSNNGQYGYCNSTCSGLDDFCGNGVLDTAEQCDDGNNDNNDGCSSVCVEETGWECSGDPSICDADCGDGIIVPGEEQCDDGNVIDHDSCSSDCQNEVYDPSWCGDNVIFVGVEECDDGNSNNLDGCLDVCVLSGCGDGYVHPAEECDDNNTSNNDGCSSTCTVENGWDCDEANPSNCISLCGNGVLNSGEECDDGNNDNNDGCSSVCVEETGWECTGTPSVCTGCGDGVVEVGVEECDPNDPNFGTHCNSSCECNDNSDYCILSKLYFSTNGNNWIQKDNWFIDSDLDNWYGIDTNVNDRVTSINLPNNDLSGSLPIIFNDLDQLNTVDLSYSNIGNFETTMDHLYNLSSLNLSGTNFDDPTFIQDLTNLNYLYLEDNDIIYMNGLDMLVNLDTLNLANNNINDISGVDFESLNSLSNLNLSNNLLALSSCDKVYDLSLKPGLNFIYSPQKNGFSYFNDCPYCGNGNIDSGEECDPPGLIINPIFSFIEQDNISSLDGANNDYFGYSVAIDGDYAVVGAYDDDDYGVTSGAAYVFQKSGANWNQRIKLTASDLIGADYFGGSVAIDGDYIVIGAHRKGSDDSGAVYVFQRNGTGWNQEAKLTASDAGADDYFGTSVAIDGDYIVVGAEGDNEDGATSGAAYVFQRNGTGWNQEAKLTASDANSYFHFGYSVAIDGDYIVIGAYYADDSGSAYVFQRNGSGWNQEAKLTASDAGVDDYFGYSVAIDGDYIVIGAKDNNDDGIDSGSAYVFQRNGTGWNQEAKLTASDPAAGDYFGNSVDIFGDYIVIGSKMDDDNGSASGSAYVFQRNGTGWNQEAKLTASDGMTYDFFGMSVAISNDTIIVGAHFDNFNGIDSGSVYIFGDGCVTASGVMGVPMCGNDCLLDCQ